VRDDGPARRVGRIVEVEAYIGEADRASHARFGRTRRNEVMYGAPGIAYVYLVYGMHDCLNVVTEPAGRPAAVLIRAVAPVEGIDAMREARAMTADARRRAARGDTPERSARSPREVAAARLASGPGLVAAAFGVTRADTGRDLCDPDSRLRLEADPAGAPDLDVTATPRIGIGYAGEPWVSLPWRLQVTGHPSASGAARARARA
jgi:DNA-3-methyladenine glycosylase